MLRLKSSVAVRVVGVILVLSISLWLIMRLMQRIHQDEIQFPTERICLNLQATGDVESVDKCFLDSDFPPDYLPQYFRIGVTDIGVVEAGMAGFRISHKHPDECDNIEIPCTLLVYALEQQGGARLLNPYFVRFHFLDDILVNIGYSD